MRNSSRCGFPATKSVRTGTSVSPPELSASPPTAAPIGPMAAAPPADVAAPFMLCAPTGGVGGHALLEPVTGGRRVGSPLVATPVLTEYEPNSSLVPVPPAGPPRLQTDALAGLDE